MMENKTEINTIADSFAALTHAVQRFNQENFNQKLVQGPWSPAMVTQHLVLAGTDFDKILLGNTKPTEGAADARVQTLKDILLNYETKMASPEFIEPADQIYDQQVLLDQLQQIEANVTAALPALDLVPTCLDFELPVIGHISRLEAVWFLIYHTQRHTHQLNEMANQNLS